MPTFCYHHISGVKADEAGKVYCVTQVFIVVAANEESYLTYLEKEKRSYKDFGHEIQLLDNAYIARNDWSNSNNKPGIVLRSYFYNFGEISSLSLSFRELITEEIMSKSWIFNTEVEYHNYGDSSKKSDRYSQVSLFLDPERYFLRVF